VPRTTPFARRLRVTQHSTPRRTPNSKTQHATELEIHQPFPALPPESPLPGSRLKGAIASLTRSAIRTTLDPATRSSDMAAIRARQRTGQTRPSPRSTHRQTSNSHPCPGASHQVRTRTTGTSSAAHFTREAGRGNPPVETPAGRPVSTSHLPTVQTDPRLDPTPAAYRRPSRPMDRDDPRGLHATASGLRCERRSAPPMKETRTARTPVTHPGPSRVSAPTREDTISSRCAETLPAGAQTPARPRQHPPHSPLRRTPRHHNRCTPTPAKECEVRQSSATPHRLKIKLIRRTTIKPSSQQIPCELKHCVA
jgi:hypothetical protein